MTEFVMGCFYKGLFPTKDFCPELFDDRPENRDEFSSALIWKNEHSEIKWGV